jgi:hypothetical protein
LPPSVAQLIEYPASEVPQYTPAPAAIVIKTDEEYTAVAERLKVITSFRRKVQDFFAPHKRRANDAHKALCEDERNVLAPADGDERRLKTALVAYTTEQDRKRRDEEARLRAQQRQDEETRRLEEAAALETEATRTGDLAMQEQAEQLIEAPIPVMPVEAATPAPPKVEGLSYRDVARGEVVDIWKLVEAALKNDQLRAFLKIEPNQSAIDAMARSLRERMAIPGVQLRVEKIPVTRLR